MKLLIHGRNLEITPALKEYTHSKMLRAMHHFEGIVKEADVHLSIARNPRVPQQIAEVTVFANGAIIRAQEKSENLYASIDLVANKICRQLRKYKDRHNSHGNHQGNNSSIKQSIETSINEFESEEDLPIEKEARLPQPGIKHKYFSMEPMSINEARQQLDLIDHDFYLFKNQETNQLQVIYKRNHGGYGVIQENI